MHPIKCRDVFLYCMAFTYLWAFGSLYYQIPGLYGEDGITPVRSALHDCSSNEEGLFDCAVFGEQPSVLHFFHHWLNLSASQSMELATLLGMTLAAFAVVFRGGRDMLVFFLLWALYFSCFQIGQPFLWFQWDTLLVEVGFLCVLVAPFRILRTRRTEWLPHDNVSLFLVRWLTFRLMFASGIVKLTSHCPTWWGLTALNYHFESQCIPTPLAWFAHNSPEWIRRLGVSLTYLIEIIIPICFLVPLKHIRKVAFLSQVALMALIMLTGNYNFFNLVYAFICLPMLVDSDNSVINTHKIMGKVGSRVWKVTKSVLIGCCYGAVLYYWIRLFNVQVKFGGKNAFEISTEVAFTKAEFYRVLAWAVPYLCVGGTLLFVAEVLTAVLRCVTDFRSRFRLVEFWSMLQCLVMCTVCGLMFAISLVPLSYLDRGTMEAIPPKIKLLHKFSDKYQLTHSYGLFRSMTGVGGRPELIIEGSESLDGPWHPYEFYYKPGRLDRKPPFIAPHQPRLDWQMWFAALGSYHREPWFLSLVYRLLKNEPSVLALIETNPFQERPPYFIRTSRYLYSFTDYTSNNQSEWWSRKFDGEFLPPLGDDNPSLANFMTERKYIGLPREKQRHTSVSTFLLRIREHAAKFKGPEFVWASTLSVYLVHFLKRKLSIV